ncbi:MAG: hypothetical protein KME15_06965 [Drouetiella hepatica Uher 2000/2452]|uniref:Uncharacterized protein n=1 Tax=Drouetiella hepatica Uher 2000/2452 TaxID=904376 RepID=A0A951Q8V1_9CYAN|nr:hypothetical protein [Drouetiella hepatica Uher 2000/2452]
MNNDRKRQPHYGDRQALQPFMDDLPVMSPLSFAPAALVLNPPSNDTEPSSYRLSPKTSEMPYLIHWLQSGGNLDFMVLALCSCVLTVLCHQPTVLPGEATSTPSSSQSTQVNFAIKAGLLTKLPKQTTPKLRSDDPDDSN